MTKSELLASIRRERATLDALIASIPRERMTEPSLEGDRSVKDVLAHISAWEKICMALIRNNTPVDPTPPGETGQSTTDMINEKIYEGSRDQALEDVEAEARRSYAELLAFIDSLSDEQLDTAIGGGDAGPRIGELFGGNSDGHYREHIAQLERWLGGGAEGVDES
jgi:hypothetical protein